MKILLFTFLLTSFFVQADCPNVRLDQNGGPFSHIPVQFQAHNMCGGYVAAQMIDAWRFAHGDTDYSHLTSPVMTVTQHYEANNEVAPESFDFLNFPGNPDEIMTTLFRQGSCSERVTSENERHVMLGVPGDKISSQNVTYNIEQELFPLYERFHRLNALFESNEINNLHHEVVNEVICEFEPVLSNTDSITSLTRDVIAALRRSTPMEFFQSLFLSMCGQGNLKRIMPRAKIVKYNASGIEPHKYPGDLIEHVDARLNAGHPVSFNYCKDVIHDPNYRGITAVYPQTEFACRSSYHASIIMGSRQRNGRCEYLVRNSYGSSCHAYENIWDCENGDTWIEREALMSNTDRMSWLEAK
ncbi:MAG: hypothetical protein CME62_05190 [Halobacteriovoraceae bacterium]|nr:hypothetical protein [Halobacteriovoraceae bacterium]